MKKITFILSLLLGSFLSQAQDYQISFTGIGASNTVGTVTVENLTQGKSITISGTEVLHLVKIVTGLDPILNQNKALLIFPNPTKDNSTMEFVATASGKANIELFDISGKIVVTDQVSLPIGTNSFQISGLGSGIFTVRIASQAYTYTGKLVSSGTPNSKVKISYIGNASIPVIEKKLKSANAEKAMQYNPGDRLKITGKSGIYSTVIVDVPTQNKTITFKFVACTDADGNNYPVVQIGTILWMAENLKTMKYRDGSLIPNVTDNNAWYNLTTGAYCNYNNNAAIGTKYGKLYNWYAVHDSRNIAPVGWHVPTDLEWSTLKNRVAANLGASGSISKALASTTDWASSYYTGAIGNDLTKNNTTGFTALPGGYYFSNEAFYYVGNHGFWWSSSESSSTNAWYRHFGSDHSFVGGSNIFKSCGLSVRCVIGDNIVNILVPTVTTNPITNITQTTATSGGNISSDGGATVTERGVCYSTSINPTTTNSKFAIGTGVGNFSNTITGLTANITYYVRAYAINGQGTAYGNEVSFKANLATTLASLTTNTPTDITSSSATLGGNLNSDGGATVTERGVCYSTSINPTTTNSKFAIGTGVGNFSNTITGLTANITYYVRAYAINGQGTAYGNEVSFKTAPSGTAETVTDIDGNIYHTVTIGSQVWMLENLKTTKYRDGSPIPNVTDDDAWVSPFGAYCNYGNNETNGTKYGKLYNWYTVNTGKLAPVGWHVPTVDEWSTLKNHVAANLGASGSIAKALASTTDWASSDHAGDIGNDLTKNNTTGFTALPGGSRGDLGGAFNSIGVCGIWWSSTESSADYAWYWDLDFHSSTLFSSGTGKSCGFSVRCVKDK